MTTLAPSSLAKPAKTEFSALTGLKFFADAYRVAAALSEAGLLQRLLLARHSARVRLHSGGDLFDSGSVHIG
ncbi:MAG TPA: hypothetical protein VGG97_12870 [Bryobacteraceae bacterium]|jgi:hypothetical protein